MKAETAKDVDHKPPNGRPAGAWKNLKTDKDWIKWLLEPFHSPLAAIHSGWDYAREHPHEVARCYSILTFIIILAIEGITHLTGSFLEELLGISPSLLNVPGWIKVGIPVAFSMLALIVLSLTTNLSYAVVEVVFLETTKKAVGQVVEAALKSHPTSPELKKTVEDTVKAELRTHAASPELKKTVEDTVKAELRTHAASPELKKTVEDTVKAELEAEFAKIMGHKMWTGERTFSVLETLRSDRTMGRTRWLLLNFLKDDIERGIRVKEITVVENGVTKRVPEYYEIEVRDWPLYVYSTFLAQEIDKADDSIFWLVDYRDFVRELLPVHVMEVVFSIGLEGLVPGITKEECAQKLGAAYKDNVSCLYELVPTGSLCKYCLTGTYSSSCYTTNANMCQAELGDIRIGKHDDEESRKRQWRRDLLLGALFKRIVMALKEVALPAASAHCLAKELQDFSRFCMPHVRSFGQSPVAKTRTIFWGMNLPEDGATGIPIMPLCAPQTGNESYLTAIWPVRGEDTKGRNVVLWFSGGTQDQQKAYSTWSAVHPQVASWSAVDGNCWQGVPHQTQKAILAAAFARFVTASGGVGKAKVVAATPTAGDREYLFQKGRWFDAGLYDRRLLLYSTGPQEDGRRDIVWRLYIAPVGTNGEDMTGLDALIKKDKGPAITLDNFRDALIKQMVNPIPFQEPQQTANRGATGNGATK